ESTQISITKPGSHSPYQRKESKKEETTTPILIFQNNNQEAGPGPATQVYKEKIASQNE
ncbi:5249_t:CDS:1, partial [Gigaspora margarita]